MATVQVRDGHLRALQSMRCQVCGRLLLRIDEQALRPGKTLEIRCKCNAFNYQVGHTTETT
jgi:phage FluMu protein Com